MNLKEAKFRGEENQLRPKTNHLELPCCAKLPQSNSLKKKVFLISNMGKTQIALNPTAEELLS